MQSLPELQGPCTDHTVPLASAVVPQCSVPCYSDLPGWCRLEGMDYVNTFQEVRTKYEQNKESATSVFPS